MVIILILVITNISGYLYISLFMINLLALLIVINQSNILIKKNVTDFEEKMEIHEKILKFIAHDLKAPLVSISAFNKDIMNKDAKNVFLEENNRINDSISSIKNLLDRFVNLSKIKTKPLERDWKDIDLVVRSMIFANSNLFNGIEYQINYDIDGYEVNMDEFYFGRIIKNLVENAVKYRKPDKKVELEILLKSASNNYIFSFNDNGIGIDEDDFNKIFETNYRSDPNKEIEGLGYGLALIKFIVDKHGWVINVNSELNKFTNFEIKIPYSDVRNKNG